MIRVLIVDDSTTMRHYLRESLAADPEMLIVGEAGDGAKAVELCERLRPDVVTMDMLMPKMSGLAATEHIMAECPTPILVVSSADRQELFTMYDALAAGAVDSMEKPHGDASDAGWDVRLCAALRMVSRIRVIKHPRAKLDGRVRTAVVEPPPAAPVPESALQVVVLGASTGGPGALTELLRALPAFRTPLLCVQHIAASEPFAEAFSDWLAGQTRRRVSYAQDRTPLHNLAGRVLLAPPDRHIYLRDGSVRVGDGPPRHNCRPSVDVLFESAADEYGAAAAGCLLTGMGRDGAEGLLRMRSRGGVTYAQDEASSTVYGMPREAALLGAAAFILPPAQIAARIAELLPASEALAMNPTVLIVDDSLTVRMDLHESFEADGFRTILCATGAEARSAFTGARFQVAVLDRRLPDADGLDLLRELHAHPGLENTVTMMLSSGSDIADRLKGLRIGADEYVDKPYDAEYVVARARQLLGEPHSGDRRITVLVIDDSITFRQRLVELLEPEGYAVLTASSGEAGLRVAADRRPQAVIVDGVMPGIDGATVIRRIRLDPALRDTPCLLMTAADDYATEVQMLEAGADGFVRKQQDLAVVLAKLAAVLRQTSGQPPVEPGGSLRGASKVLSLSPDWELLHGLGEALRADGYEVLTAASAEEALQLLAAQPVDCIVFDYDGPDGREACRRIKEVPQIGDTPLVMTGRHDFDMLDCLAAGADDYVRSVDGPDALRAHVRTQIRRKHSHEESRRIREELVRRELDAAEERAARQLAETRAALVEELEWRNRELEAFSGSVSHDLRGPLQIISSFAETMLYEDDETLGTQTRHRVRRIHAAAARMGDLVESLLILARASRGELRRHAVDMTSTAWEVTAEVQARDPARKVDFTVQPAMTCDADEGLLRVILENLINNAVKFTGKVEHPAVEIGVGESGYYVRDNGAGFPAGLAGELFRPFARLHKAEDFPGTGIGLTTVHRAVERHGGEIWAASADGEGATFWFTLPPAVQRRG